MASISSWNNNSHTSTTAGFAPPAAAATMAELEELIRVIRITPAINNHAHPVLGREDAGNLPLLAITTDAKGEDPDAAAKSLALQRSQRQLAAVLQCESSREVVMSAIKSKRLDEAEYGRWVAKCFTGVETVLFEDRPADRGRAHTVAWHDQFLGSHGSRIFGIEAVAAEIIDSHAEAYYRSSSTTSGRRRRQSSDHVFDMMLEEFGIAVKQAIENMDIAGFSSVICHRTGLGIRKAVDIAAARDSFEEILENYGIRGKFKTVSHKGLSDLFVHHTAVLIRDCSTHFRKPIQFHTGLGGNEVSLVKSSPALLESFIRAYPVVPIVLLSASYPYVREAGYLAGTHANLHVDVGDIFPSISQEGQETILKVILELCPWSKILWSTGSHGVPELFFLANIQGREALHTVLCELVRRGHLACTDAIKLCKAVLFENSNRLYNLELRLSDSLETPDESDSDDVITDGNDGDD